MGWDGDRAGGHFSTGNTVEHLTASLNGWEGGREHTILTEPTRSSPSFSMVANRASHQASVCAGGRPVCCFGPDEARRYSPPPPLQRCRTSPCWLSPRTQGAGQTAKVGGAGPPLSWFKVTVVTQRSWLRDAKHPHPLWTYGRHPRRGTSPYPGSSAERVVATGMAGTARRCRPRRQLCRLVRTWRRWPMSPCRMLDVRYSHIRTTKPNSNVRPKTA